ncbi:hypothetical protein H3N56_06825 [Cetobacterium sp. 2A]|uniref:hypothetical protein n=1 Tax=Cetobacterium sp. 2A TaxID=2754723 RepID=UPI00163D145D|nr:hypothetical protein [Cetobacterium sp. 2A]MBC2856186.1 hypothetical protein [Cetobacterium sp. 2A]
MLRVILGISQDYLNSNGLNLVDAVIFNYIFKVDSLPKTVTKYFDGDRYIWLNYKAMIEWLPVLGFTSTDPIRKRLEKYEKLGLVTKKVLRQVDEFPGSYIFVKLSEDFYNLFRAEKSDENNYYNYNNKIKNNKKIMNASVEKAVPENEDLYKRLEKKYTATDMDRKKLLDIFFNKMSENEQNVIKDKAYELAKLNYPEAQLTALKVIGNSRFRYDIIQEIILN